MAIMTRLARLIRADFHAVLDQIEEPQLLLQQAIREMDEAVAADSERLVEIERRLRDAARRDTELSTNLDQIAAELDVCFEADHVDLAKAQLRRKLEVERLRSVLVENRTKWSEQAKHLRDELATKKIRLDGLKQKAELFAEKSDAGPVAEFSVTDEEVEMAFLREQSKRAGASA